MNIQKIVESKAKAYNIPVEQAWRILATA